MSSAYLSANNRRSVRLQCHPILAMVSNTFRQTAVSSLDDASPVPFKYISTTVGQFDQRCSRPGDNPRCLVLAIIHLARQVPAFIQSVTLTTASWLHQRQCFPSQIITSSSPLFNGASTPHHDLRTVVIVQTVLPRQDGRSFRMLFARSPRRSVIQTALPPQDGGSLPIIWSICYLLGE